MEEKWAAKLDNAMEESGLLKTHLEYKERDEAAASKNHATLSNECKGRGKEITALHEAVADLK